MKSPVLKNILKGVLALFLLFALMMSTPRIIGLLFPSKPPVGYHYDVLSYLALGTGLEQLIDMEPEIPQNVVEIKDVEYKNVNGKSLQIDFYRPANAKKALPLLVFIHGGGWKGGKRSDYLSYLVSFAQKGYMTATLSYRLKRDSIYPAAVEDVNDAVRWLFANGDNWGYDSQRIALIGGSAGAHLAMLAGYGWGESAQQDELLANSSENHRIKVVVDIYGPTDLTTEYAQTQSLVTGFLGHSYDDKPQLFKEASPVTYLKSSLPPTLILHGTSDRLVPVSQSDILKTELDRLGVPCVYYRLPLWPHTMDVAKRVNRFAQEKMEDFFEKYLKQP